VKFQCNFSLDHYFEVLEYAKKSHEIGPVKDFYKLKKENKFLILRHDIDLSIDIALEMARLESQHNISSTYFVLLHSQHYNAISEHNVQKIKDIIDYGHEIGLHYDPMFPRSNYGIINMINEETKLLGNLIKKEIISITPHNLSTATQRIDYNNVNFFDITNPEILNSVKYISDSVQNWRNGCMCNHIDHEDRLIILTHPIWWTKYSNSLNKILAKFENDQINTLKEAKIVQEKLYQVYLEKLQNKEIS